MRCGPLYYRKEGILMIPNFVAMAISSQEPTLLLVSNKNAGSGQVRVFCACVESSFSSKSRSALRIKDPEVRKSDLAESAFLVMTKDVGTRLFQGGDSGIRARARRAKREPILSYPQYLNSEKFSLKRLPRKRISQCNRGMQIHAASIH